MKCGLGRARALHELPSPPLCNDVAPLRQWQSDSAPEARRRSRARTHKRTDSQQEHVVSSTSSTWRSAAAAASLLRRPAPICVCASRAPRTRCSFSSSRAGRNVLRWPSSSRSSWCGFPSSPTRVGRLTFRRLERGGQQTESDRANENGRGRRRQASGRAIDTRRKVRDFVRASTVSSRSLALTARAPNATGQKCRPAATSIALSMRAPACHCYGPARTGNISRRHVDRVSG